MECSSEVEDLVQCPRMSWTTCGAQLGNDHRSVFPTARYQWAGDEIFKQISSKCKSTPALPSRRQSGRASRGTLPCSSRGVALPAAGGRGRSGRSRRLEVRMVQERLKVRMVQEVEGQDGQGGWRSGWSRRLEVRMVQEVGGQYGKGGKTGVQP